LQNNVCPQLSHWTWEKEAQKTNKIGNRKNTNKIRNRKKKNKIRTKEKQKTLEKVQPLTAQKVREKCKSLKHFAGVISIEDLNNALICDVPICFVININAHWIGIWVSRRFIEIYDGLGDQSGLTKNKYFTNFLCNNLINRRLRYTRQIQSDTSVLCGQLSVTCLHLRVNDVSFDSINANFSDDFHKNDKLIQNLFQDL